jgi:hypothetical protein
LIDPSKKLDMPGIDKVELFIGEAGSLTGWHIDDLNFNESQLLVSRTLNPHNGRWISTHPEKKGSRRTHSCERSGIDLVDQVMQEQASNTKPRKGSKMAEVNNLLDARLSQIQDELNGHLHTRMERLGSDIGLRIMPIEVSVTNLETSTRQQIDLGAAATERTKTHVNNEIAEMNKKLDNVNQRLGAIEVQLADTHQ